MLTMFQHSLLGARTTAAGNGDAKRNGCKKYHVLVDISRRSRWYVLENSTRNHAYSGVSFVKFNITWLTARWASVDSFDALLTITTFNRGHHSRICCINLSLNFGTVTIQVIRNMLNLYVSLNKVSTGKRTCHEFVGTEITGSLWKYIQGTLGNLELILNNLYQK